MVRIIFLVVVLNRETKGGPIMSIFFDERKVYRNLVNGEWVLSGSGRTIDIISPVDGSLVGSVQAVTRQEVDRTIEVSKSNLSEWAEIPIYEKANILYKAAALLEERADEISDVLVMEIAKDKKSAVSEIKRTSDFLRFTADTGKSMEGLAIGGENFPGGSRNKISFVRKVSMAK